MVYQKNVKNKNTPNENVLIRANTDEKLLAKIRTRQIKFLGHFLSKERIERLTLTGKIEENRARDRQRITILRELQN